MNLDTQINVLKSEIRRRKKFDVHLIESGKMSKEELEYQRAALEAALQTLTQLKGIAEKK